MVLRDRERGTHHSLEKLRCQKSDPCKPAPASAFLEREGM